MFKKVKNGNHVIPQPVRKHMRKAHSAKMNITYPNRVYLMYITNKTHTNSCVRYVLYGDAYGNRTNRFNISCYAIKHDK